MKKESITASKKTETITKPKTIINLGEDLPICSAVSNVDLGNYNLSISENIKDLLALLVQQIGDIRDFLNLSTKCMGPKPNLNDDLSDFIFDKNLFVENEILKLEEADKENTFLRGETKDLTVLLHAKIQTSFHNLKTYTNKYLLQENYDTQAQLQFSFQTNSPKGYMFYKQNNFPNKRNYFIPQIDSDLGTPTTSDPGLESSVHSIHNNNKTLELFRKAQ